MAKSGSTERVGWSAWVSSISTPQSEVGRQVMAAWATWASDLAQAKKAEKVREVIGGIGPFPVADWAQVATTLATLIKARTEQIGDYEVMGRRFSDLENFIRGSNDSKAP